MRIRRLFDSPTQSPSIYHSETTPSEELASSSDIGNSPSESPHDSPISGSSDRAITTFLFEDDRFEVEDDRFEDDRFQPLNINNLALNNNINNQSSKNSTSSGDSDRDVLSALLEDKRLKIIKNSFLNPAKDADAISDGSGEEELEYTFKRTREYRNDLSPEILPKSFKKADIDEKITAPLKRRKTGIFSHQKQNKRAQTRNYAALCQPASSNVPQREQGLYSLELDPQDVSSEIITLDYPATPMKCPSAPMKLSRFVKEKFSAFEEGANALAAKIANFSSIYPITIKIGSRQITINRIIEKFKSGNYHDAYRVEGTGLKTETFVLKVLKEEYRTKKTSNEICSIIRNEYKQYFLLKKLFDKIIATYYDLEILAENKPKEFDEENPAQSMSHGCHLVEYVPTSYPISSVVSMLPPLETNSREADAKLKKLFQTAYENKNQALDLQKSNIGFDTQGNLKIFDPMHPQNEKFYLIVGSALASFAPEGSERYQYLDPRKNYS
jgi:hypothetical protein